MKNETWVNKYAPDSVDDMILSEKDKKTFNGIIKSGDSNNLLLYGSPGIGKTTLARIISKTVDADVLLQNCSVDGSIDAVKSSVTEFCEVILNKQRKIVILDEADQMSQQAQMALRNPISNYSGAGKPISFILTANYIDKIIPAIQSRCICLSPTYTDKDIMKRVIDILKAEKIQFTKDSLGKFLTNVVKAKATRDIRSIIENLQMMCVDGSLEVGSFVDTTGVEETVDYLMDNLRHTTTRDLRKYLQQNEEAFHGDFPMLAKAMFDRIIEMDVKNVDAALMTIAYAMQRMSCQLDKEIQFIWMLIDLRSTLYAK